MYYQPQPTKYNYRQNYFQDRRIQQACSKNEYDIKKIRKHGNIHSGIPTPDKNVLIIPLGNNYYEIKKNQRDFSLT